MGFATESKTATAYHNTADSTLEIVCTYFMIALFAILHTSLALMVVYCCDRDNISLPFISLYVCTH
jgi:hypothetical protein